MQQLSISFEPGLAQQYDSLRDCFAACVYTHKLKDVAAALDVAPSNLKNMLGGERNLDVDLVERYMREFNDTTPALWMAARWLQDKRVLQEQAMARIPVLVDELTRLHEQLKQGAE
jgi:plasmid maintenance system antidote protein VapI